MCNSDCFYFIDCSMVIAVAFCVRINEGTRQIAQGNYSKRLPEKGSTEFSQLSRNMNEMAEAIEHNIKDLESVAEDKKYLYCKFGA